jgi:predicted metal-dependent phosphoesterase TrpH
MLKSDFHIHTGEDPYDKGFHYNAMGLIKRAAFLGFDVISITNHGRVTYDEHLAEEARKRGILLIPGCEAFIEDGDVIKDVIILNITEEERSKIKGWEGLRALKKKKGKDMLVIAPHPFFPASHSLNELLFEHRDIFDAIEMSQYSYPLFFQYNSDAAEAAHKLHLPLVWTSDAHSFRFFGRHYSMVRAEKNIQSIFEAIRQGKVTPVSQRLQTLDFIYLARKMLWIQLKKKLMGYEGEAF